MTDRAQAPRFRRRPDVFFTIVDDELIIMQDGGDRFLSSNAVASTVWTALAEPVSLEAIGDRVLAAFDGASRATVLVDVEELVAALQGHGLVDAVTAG